MDFNTRTSLPEHLTTRQRRRLRLVYSELRIEVLSVYWWHVRAGWEMKPRRLPDDFFFAPMTHHIDARVERKEATVTTGQCMFVREGVRHSSRMPADCASFQIVAIHAHLLPLWGGRIDQIVGDPFQNLPDLAASQARLQRATHLMQTDMRLGKRMAEHLLRDWLAFWTLHEAEPKESQMQSDPRIAQALTTIHEQFAEPLTVEHLADAVRLSPAQFRKLFKQTHSLGPKAYIAQHRLKQAAQLLRGSKAAVKEIAYDVGFADPHYFHLSFRKQFGCTPLDYRKRTREMV